MNRKILMALVAMVAFVSLAEVRADQEARGLVLTWQNKHGFWFACGPVQCIQAGEKTEEKAMDYVLQDHHSITYDYKFGRCKQYIVDGMKPWDASAEKVKRRAHCD